MLYFCLTKVLGWLKSRLKTAPNRHMLGGYMATSFMCTVAVAQMSSVETSLRGPRRVQWNGDSNQKVVPQCVTGNLAQKKP